MTCQECIEVLFEEESDGTVGREAVVHLSECGDCRGLAREIRANAAALRSMRDEALPITAPIVVAKRPWPLYLPWAAAAALVVSVGLGVWLSSIHPSNTGLRAKSEAAPSSRPAAAATMPAEPGAKKYEASNQQSARTLRSVKQDAVDPTQTSRLKDIRAVALPATDPGHPAPVKILTGDPNVVIYLVLGETSVEAKSEGEIL